MIRAIIHSNINKPESYLDTTIDLFSKHTLNLLVVVNNSLDAILLQGQRQENQGVTSIGALS